MKNHTKILSLRKEACRMENELSCSIAGHSVDLRYTEAEK